MKRFFVVFLSVILSVLLCVNVAFADTVSINQSSGINIYFPWFGGITSSGSRVTNYGTVTQSDISFTGLSVSNSATNLRSYNRSDFIVVQSGDSLHITGAVDSIFNASISSSFMMYQDHVYLVDTFNSNDQFRGVRFNSFGLSYFANKVVFRSTFTGNATGGYQLFPDVNYDVTITPLVLDLTEIFGAGSEPSSYSDAVSKLSDIFGSYEYRSVWESGVSSFSLVPRTGTPNFYLTQPINDYQYYNFEADVSLSGSSSLFSNLSDYFVDGDYGLYLWNWGEDTASVNMRYGWLYCTSSFANFYKQVTQNQHPNYSVDVVPYTLGSIISWDYVFPGSNSISIQVDSTLVPVDFNTNMASLSSDYSYIMLSLVSSYKILGDKNNYSNVLIGLSDGFISYLNSDKVLGTGSSEYDGTISINRILSTTDYIYFYNNNYINSGAYDFNVNVKFPSITSFNSFSGVWSATVNTSWGEVPVRTQVQEVSSNSDSLIKIYKLTFDVPFTGSYSKFNIRYIGPSNIFTTIRVDASVVDPNFLDSASPSSIRSFSFWLSSKFDQFWAKVRSLFLDQDQTMQESIPSELAEQNNTVRSGTEAIHDFETQTFDNIDQTQESIDWETPDSFGSVDSSGSAIGFVASIFTSFFNSIGSNMQNIIVIPLVLGLVLVVLGRGQMALGRALSAPKPKPKGGRK